MRRSEWLSKVMDLLVRYCMHCARVQIFTGGASGNTEVFAVAAIDA